MKLKKKIRNTLIVLFVIMVGIGSYFLYKNILEDPTQKEIKVVNKIDKYGYELKDNKPKKYKEMFEELKEILTQKEVNEEKYVKKISEMFIYDFYSLNDKTSKTDIGGVDFVYSGIRENFLKNAQDTYYKYVENNIYDNRKQSLPVVSNITIDSVDKESYEYEDKSDDEAYNVKVSWTYTDDKYTEYQKDAKLVFIHDDIKLSLVELQ